MLRTFAGSVGGLLLVAGVVSGFEVQATIRKIDLEKSMVFFFAKDKERGANRGNLP